MRIASRTVLSVALVFAAATRLAGQEPQAGTVTLERIFGAGEFFPAGFGPARWIDDSTYATVEPGPNGAEELVRYAAASGRRSVLAAVSALTPAGSGRPLELVDYTLSPDHGKLLIFTNARRVWRQRTRGDYWVLDLARGTLRKLGGDAAPSTLMFAKFAPDGRRVAYVRNHDLYVEQLADGRITRLTRDGSPTIINGTFDWVYEEELNLRDGFRWSPDGTRIAYWQLDASGVRDFDLIDDTDSLYSYVKPVQYPKAGTTNSAARVGVVSAAGGPTTWLRVPGDPRNNYIARLQWADNSTELVLQHLNRLQDTDRVMLADARTGAVHTLLTETDSAWVDVVDDLRWIDGGKRFTWVSERDGWRHLYSAARDGGDLRLITHGDFDIYNPNSAFGEPDVLGTDRAAGEVYFTASPENPTQLYLYRARLDGTGAVERVTPANEPGTHEYDIAPGAHWALHTYSRFDTPPVTELVHLPDHRRVRTLVDNADVRERVAALRKSPVEFFRVDGGAGAMLDAWMIKPPDFDSTKKYPVLFYVYGEPAAQTVLDAYDPVNYPWFLMLAQQGYIVASVDNHGTPGPRGRAWRKAIYRKIGVLASAEQTAAAKAIAKRPYVDASRIGVWGWSGGGSMTLNLLFRSPDVYRMGMAVAPVSNLRYYDTIYQERYMGLPAQNAADYARGSPITFASQLRGDLLLVHGSGDDNVHFQNTEALVDTLVAHDKPFTMMDYPNRSHCICEGQGTTLHLYQLLTRYLHEHLPVDVAPSSAAAGATGAARP